MTKFFSKTFQSGSTNLSFKKIFGKDWLSGLGVMGTKQHVFQSSFVIIFITALRFLTQRIPMLSYICILETIHKFLFQQLKHKFCVISNTFCLLFEKVANFQIWLRSFRTWSETLFNFYWWLCKIQHHRLKCNN